MSKRYREGVSEKHTPSPHRPPLQKFSGGEFSGNKIGWVSGMVVSL